MQGMTSLCAPLTFWCLIYTDKDCLYIKNVRKIIKESLYAPIGYINELKSDRNG